MATEDQAKGTKEMEVMEQKKVCLMRAIVESQDPTSKDVDDLMIRRFLRARGLDIQQGSALFLKYLKWRRSFVPNGFISESEITSNLAHKKVFLQGLDKRFVVYTLDRICARMPAGQEKLVAIEDMKGWGYYLNNDTRGCLAALSILQDNYPERLGKMYLVHVSSIFMAAWKLVYPFIDSNTKKKIVFVENKKLESTLLEDIDESQLPEIYRGKQPLVPIEES
ncbi:hypothetical protein MKX03_027006 [Papaver bracteatum]|nr:hypothetical protein MKX03_027006 [Papaver bracteatum]